MPKPLSSAKPTRLPPAPRLPDDMEPRELEVIRSFDNLEQCVLSGCDISKQIAERVSFDAVRVDAGSMAETHLSKLRWTDVLSARCDLSTIVWSEAKLNRVELRDCRMTGAMLVDSELDAVRFVGCHLAYATFSGARFRQVTFESCRLEEANFGRANLVGTTFLDCELRGVDFEGCNLKDVDVRTSHLTDVKVGVKDLRGLIVNAAQAASLASLLGLVVRDD